MLKKIEMDPDELEFRTKYIWEVGGVCRIVHLSSCGNELVDEHGIYWFFEDDLEGQLYGPIEFEL